MHKDRWIVKLDLDGTQIKVKVDSLRPMLPLERAALGDGGGNSGDATLRQVYVTAMQTRWKEECAHLMASLSKQEGVPVEERLIRGDLVVLKGLKAGAAYNGLQGAVLRGPGEEERFVILLPSKKAVKIKKPNLVITYDVVTPPHLTSPHLT